MKADILIIGGAGHIGLPLGILFANKGRQVILYDKDKHMQVLTPYILDRRWLFDFSKTLTYHE